MNNVLLGAGVNKKWKCLRYVSVVSETMQPLIITGSYWAWLSVNVLIFLSTVQTQLSSLLRVLSNDPWDTYVGLSLSVVTRASASDMWPTFAVPWPRAANQQWPAIMWSAAAANKQAATQVTWSATANQQWWPTIITSHIRQLSISNCHMICGLLSGSQRLLPQGIRERPENVRIWWKLREWSGKCMVLWKVAYNWAS